METIKHCKDEIEVGHYVETNGDGRNRTMVCNLKGEVVQKGKEFFYLAHNDDRCIGRPVDGLDPTDYGYKYIWCIGLDSPAWIELTGKNVSNQISSATFNLGPILGATNPKPMNVFKRMSAAIRALLDPNTTTLAKANFVNEDLSLSSEGRAALDTLLLTDYKAKLAVVAQKKLDDVAEEKRNS